MDWINDMSQSSYLYFNPSLVKINIAYCIDYELFIVWNIVENIIMCYMVFSLNI